MKFARVDDAANLMTNGCYFSKVDLRKAYRSVKVSYQSQQVTGAMLGFQWAKCLPKGHSVTFQGTSECRDLP